ncbi:hypothetical protein DM01DRAFT_260139 [Hesseltinella vesiculosa]|uniref:Uncharacterized protein n=1 Tax=Hesseltinella vesiculosa TaxID=101127 RepID=A0A1X2G9X9_9FUNG|nr:hypothetical protein DM01DRAFT_260139 [Hesseltinella vesiculosa]
MVQSLDVTTAFFNFQKSILNNKWKLTLEDHMHSAMAVQSILFLASDQYNYDDISTYFNQTMYAATIQTIESAYGIKKPRFPMETITKTLSVIQDVSSNIISRAKGIRQLMDLDLPSQQTKFVKSIIQLMGKLPRHQISNDINESELGSRFIDPFLCGLFDDPDQGIFLRWTNELTLEARKDCGPTTKNRPDICITSLHGRRLSISHGFGEVKSAAFESNHFFLCKDLLRVATFCKDALDAGNMEAVLGIQAIGRDIYFYVLLLPTNGVYVFLELGKVQVPNCIQDLPKLVMDAPLLLLIIDVFERLCTLSPHTLDLNRHRPTIDRSIFNQIFSTSQNRKRLCPLQRSNN